MLVKLDQNGVPVEWPVNENRIKHENPNVSFPRDVTKIDVAAYGYAKFAYADPQDHDAEYQNCTEVTPVLDGDTYVQTWSLSDKYTVEERTAYDAKKAEDAIVALEAQHRSKRDQLLKDSDWTQVADAPVDATAWATYRQALRDITDHVNFPYVVEADWPIKP